MTTTESILLEAQRLTHGDRQNDYGHPFDNYTQTAALVSAMLVNKLREPLTAHEMALVMVCVKLSREVYRPKRDNLVDAAGYAWVAQECREEGARRKAEETAPKQDYLGRTIQPMSAPLPAILQGLCPTDLAAAPVVSESQCSDLPLGQSSHEPVEYLPAEYPQAVEPASIPRGDVRRQI